MLWQQLVPKFINKEMKNTILKEKNRCRNSGFVKSFGSQYVFNS